MVIIKKTFIRQKKIDNTTEEKKDRNMVITQKTK